MSFSLLKHAIYSVACFSIYPIYSVYYQLLSKFDVFWGKFAKNSVFFISQKNRKKCEKKEKN